MAAVTICSDFGTPENKVCNYFHCFPIYLPWSDGTRCHDLSFLNTEVFFFFFPIFFQELLIDWLILLYNTVLVFPYIDLNLTWVYMCSPSWIPLPPPSPSHPSESSQCISPKHLVSCIKPGLVIRFTYDILHVQCHSPISFRSCPLPQSPKDCLIHLFLLSYIQGYHYHLSKFHIYALVYCICGFFLAYFTLYNRLQFYPPH